MADIINQSWFFKDILTSQSSSFSKLREEIVCALGAHVTEELTHVIDTNFATPAPDVPLSKSEREEEEIDEGHNKSREIGHSCNRIDSADFDHRPVDSCEASCVQNINVLVTCGYMWLL